MAEKPVSHGLGFGNGSLIEHSDGSVEYRQTGKLMPALRVMVCDVVGFSVRKVTRDDKKRLNASSMQQILTIQGSGTTLAEVAVNYGTAQKIEQWFRAPPIRQGDPGFRSSNRTGPLGRRRACQTSAAPRRRRPHPCGIRRPEGEAARLSIAVRGVFQRLATRLAEHGWYPSVAARRTACDGSSLRSTGPPDDTTSVGYLIAIGCTNLPPSVRAWTTETRRQA